MGIWSDLMKALFGGSSSPARRPSPQRVGELTLQAPDDNGSFTFTHGDDFFVEGRRSPGGRFVAGTIDGHEEDGKTLSGRVGLFDATTGQAIFKVRLKRANNPQVSDEGVVTVENWKSWGGPPAGDLVALDTSGKRRWTKRFKANIFSSGMTIDGTRVWVSTCNSEHEAHSCKTFLLDTSAGKVLWTRDGFGEVRVRGNDVLIGLDGDQDRDGNQFFVLDSRGQAPAEFHAALAEREHARRAEADRQNRGKPWWTLPRVAEGLKQDDPDLAELSALLDAMQAHANSDSEQAKALRYRGEIAERLGDLPRALEHWERAIALDPKVGIKRRLTALRKTLT